jgi:tetratricopeptide (TPR) repeat protein
VKPARLKLTKFFCYFLFTKSSLPFFPEPLAMDIPPAIAAHRAVVIDSMLRRARDCTAKSDDEAAQRVYLDILRLDPAHRLALNELGLLALNNGYRDAARTVFQQAAHHHPDDLTASVTLGNMALEDGDLPAARGHYQSALAQDAACAPAHQGMARVLTLLGDDEAARPHWDRGFSGHATVPRHYRGIEPGLEMLFLAASRGGNVRLRPWMDDRIFAVTVIYADYFDITRPLPPHSLVVNAIGDADLCPEALDRAQAIVAQSPAPVINHPALVQQTGRIAISRLCAGIAGLTAPRIALTSRTSLLTTPPSQYPLLLRAPGFHTGQHFVRVDAPEDLARALALLPGDALFTIDYLNAAGPDGMVRKYRVMFIDGAIYPWHLAIGADWKLHYYTATMADHPAHRAEEQRFLDNMPEILGGRAMAALRALQRALALDYAGVDFALAADGSVLLFEANATMTLNAPPPEPLWDYRRPAATAAQRAVGKMLQRKASDGK